MTTPFQGRSYAQAADTGGTIAASSLGRLPFRGQPTPGRETILHALGLPDREWTDVGLADVGEFELPTSLGANAYLTAKLNNLRHVNNSLRSVVDALPPGATLVGNVETLPQRRRRLTAGRNRLASRLLLAADFLVRRALPRLPVLRSILPLLPPSKNRPMSLAEALGRVAFSGMEILHHQEIDAYTYFVARKATSASPGEEPAGALLIRLLRTGENGKPILVYKLRTMHRYAQYIQDYVHKTNDLEPGGKLQDDFRIAGWGKVLRNLYLDELPMLLNWFKRELKLVGVRPLSAHYLSLYRDELQERRLRYKPGLLPPFYADLPTSLAEIQDSEERYLAAYDVAPLSTDWKYFWRSAANVAGVLLGHLYRAVHQQLHKN